jgi:hypothetical protein
VIAVTPCDGLVLISLITIEEDTIEGGKKATSRKWRVWSVVLTGTQLLFFRDLKFASHILGLPPTEAVQGSTPELGVLNPDEVVSLYECIAVFDTSYHKASLMRQLSDAER